MMAPTNIIKKDRKRIIVLRFSDFQCCCTYIPKYLVGQFPIEKGLLCKWLIEDLLCSRLAWNLIYEKSPRSGALELVNLKTSRNAGIRRPEL